MKLEIEKLKEKDKCVVCMNEEIEIFFQSCGHACVCRNCADELQEKRKGECPLCQRKVKKKTRFFLAH